MTVGGRIRPFPRDLTAEISTCLLDPQLQSQDGKQVEKPMGCVLRQEYSRSEQKTLHQMPTP